MRHLLSKLTFEQQEGYKIAKTDIGELSSFSFFRSVIVNINDISERELQKIVDHETTHVRQFHSYDIMLYELALVAMWWNPFVWLMRSAMKLNLEYIADGAPNYNREEKKEYQYFLLRQSTNAASTALVNNFNISPLKKRITMMNKKRTSILSAAKFLLALPLAAMLLFLNAQPTQAMQTPEDNPATIEQTVATPIEQVVATASSPDKVYDFVETMPKYPGGDQALMQFLSDNIKYPEDAAKAGKEGRVVVRFVVKKDGSVGDVEVMQSAYPSLDNEAMRVVKLMPKWTPGTHDGKAVDVNYRVPIVFNLPKKTE